MKLDIFTLLWCWISGRLQQKYGICEHETPKTGLKEQNGIMVLLGNPKAIHILHSVIIIGYFTGDIVNGSKVLLEIMLNTNKSWKVLIRGKTVNPGKIGLDELYNLTAIYYVTSEIPY
jgi:hypothetical protein